MRIRNSFVHILTVSAILLIAGTASAQTYSGRAIGITATVNSGSPETSADTGELPGTGGVRNATSAAFVGAGGAVTAVTANANASGALRSSQATAVVSGFQFGAPGVLITAASVTASAGCICCPTPGNTDPTCSAGTTATIQIATASGTTTIAGSGAPNQVVNVDGFGTVTINQQVTVPLGISVIGLRIQGTAGGSAYDIRVAEARAAINCVSLIPSAGPVTLDGRVVSSTGRGISRATVTLTDKAGNAYVATTSSFGYFRLDGIPSGETYILNVAHRQYTFSPQAIGLNDNLTLTITAN